MNRMRIVQILFCCVAYVGITSTNGAEGEPVEWIFPPSCRSDASCVYTASWIFDPLQDIVTFTIVAKQPVSTWTAIGFARAGQMANVDAIYGYFNSRGEGAVIDGWIGSRYNPPTKDSSQNLLYSNITFQDGYLTMKFSRNRQSSDQSNDYSFTNTDCYYFLFPVGGGGIANDDGGIRKHYNTPLISSDKICIKSTTDITAATTRVTTSNSTGEWKMEGTATAVTNINSKPATLTTEYQAETMTTDGPSFSSDDRTMEETGTVPVMTDTAPGMFTAISTPVTASNSTEEWETEWETEGIATMETKTDGSSSMLTTGIKDVTAGVTASNSRGDWETEGTETMETKIATTSSMLTTAYEAETNSVGTANGLEQLNMTVTTTLKATTGTKPDMFSATSTQGNIQISGEWMYPPLCSLISACVYIASWIFDPLQDIVTFTIVTRQPVDTWTAIGFAQEKQMQYVDVFYGYVNSRGEGAVFDGWIGSRYNPPTKDSSQNLLYSNITFQDGYLTMKFSRNRQSSDQSNDYSFTNTDCYYFLFPVGGGGFANDDGGIRKHFSTPLISDDKICIKIPTATTNDMTTATGSIMSSLSTSQAAIGTSAAIQTPTNCTVPGQVCIPMWTEHQGQNSVNGKMEEGIYDLLECISPCEYQWNCVAVDFDRSTDPPSCWTHVDPSDLLEENVFPADNVTQYRINRTSVQRGEDCLIEWIRIPKVHSTDGITSAYWMENDCFAICRHRPDCVALEFDNTTSPPCWLHTSYEDLTDEKLYDSDTAVQYRINRTCPAPATTTLTLGRCTGQSFPNESWCPPGETIRIISAFYKVHPLCCFNLSDSSDPPPDSPLLHQFDVLMGGDAVYIAKIQACEFKETCVLKSQSHQSDSVNNEYCLKQQHKTNYVSLSYSCAKSVHQAETTSVGASYSSGGGIMTGTTTLQVTTGTELRTSRIFGDIPSSGEWMDPPLCSSNSSCNYRASWILDQWQDIVQFTIVAKQPVNTWTAIGFAPQKAMQNVDTCYGYLNSRGEGVIVDGWIGARYTAPTRDSNQNLLNSSITNQDGYLTLKFSRYRQSSDQSNDYSFTNTDCYYFLFPVGGGSFYNDDGGIGRHSSTPRISSDKICITNTGVPVSTTQTVQSSTSTSLMGSSITQTTLVAGSSSSASTTSRISMASSVGSSTSTASSVGSSTSGVSIGTSVVPPTGQTEVCLTEWFAFEELQSLNGIQLDCLNLQDGLSKCAYDRVCVAVDYDISTSPPCWMHYNDSDLDDSNIYNGSGNVTQYRKNEECFNTTECSRLMWERLPDTSSYYGIQYDYWTEYDCFRGCQYIPECKAIDFDITTGPPCWFHNSDEDLKSENTESFPGQGIVQYRLNKTSCQAETPTGPEREIGRCSGQLFPNVNWCSPGETIHILQATFKLNPLCCYLVGDSEAPPDNSMLLALNVSSVSPSYYNEILSCEGKESCSFLAKNYSDNSISNTYCPNQERATNYVLVRYGCVSMGTGSTVSTPSSTMSIASTTATNTSASSMTMSSSPNTATTISASTVTMSSSSATYMTSSPTTATNTSASSMTMLSSQTTATSTSASTMMTSSSPNTANSTSASTMMTPLSPNTANSTSASTMMTPSSPNTANSTSASTMMTPSSPNTANSTSASTMMTPSSTTTASAMTSSPTRATSTSASSILSSPTSSGAPVSTPTTRTSSATTRSTTTAVTTTQKVYENCSSADNAMYCNDLDGSLCYDETTRRRCCNSCTARYTNIPGCEFGDKWPILCFAVRNYVDKQQPCREYMVECCATCRT